jgi:hypothetical protein
MANLDMLKVAATAASGITTWRSYSSWASFKNGDNIGSVERLLDTGDSRLYNLTRYAVAEEYHRSLITSNEVPAMGYFLNLHSDYFANMERFSR